MNHVWEYDLTISSVDFYACPSFLFLRLPFAILLHLLCAQSKYIVMICWLTKYQNCKCPQLVCLCICPCVYLHGRLCVSIASANQGSGHTLVRRSAKASARRTATRITRRSTADTSPTRERVNTSSSDPDTLNHRSVSLLRTSLVDRQDLPAPSNVTNCYIAWGRATVLTVGYKTCSERRST